MLIEYKATGDRREVDKEIGSNLVGSGIARRIYKNRKLEAESGSAPEKPAEVAPKRRYRRRDMQSEG